MTNIEPAIALVRSAEAELTEDGMEEKLFAVTIDDSKEARAFCFVRANDSNAAIDLVRSLFSILSDMDHVFVREMKPIAPSEIIQKLCQEQQS